MRTPNLNALRMFDAAARHLNFRLAAEDVSLTQGAVAQQVRRLEADLGLQLFHRKARGLELTTIGKDYHRSIRKAFALIDDATQNLYPEAGRIALSVTPSFVTKWLVPRLSDFTEKYHNIDLQIIASEVLANFKTDEIDMAIRQGHPPFDKWLNYTLVANLELCAVCSPRFTDEISAIDTFDDFAEFRLIQDAHVHWQRFLDEKSIDPKHRILQFNQTSHAMDAAINGQGIALAPRLLIEEDLKQGKLITLWQDESADQSGYYLVWPDIEDKNQDRNDVINWILSQVNST